MRSSLNSYGCVIFGLMLVGSLRLYGDQPGVPPDLQPYVSRDPFYIFVSKDYPANQSMALVSASTRLSFGVESDPKSKSASASLCLPEIQTTVKLSPEKTPTELMLLLAMPGRPIVYLRDINLDGVWDIKIVPSEHKIFINANGGWQPVTTLRGDLAHLRATSQIGSFAFKNESGQWIRE